MNILPAGVLIIEKCDRFVLAVSADAESAATMKDVVAVLPEMEKVTFEIVGKPNGYSRDGPLKDWLTNYGHFSSVMRKASDHFKEVSLPSLNIVLCWRA